MKLPEFRQLIERLDKRSGATAFGGLGTIHKAHFAASIRRLTGRGVIIIASDETEAKRIAQDTAAMAGEDCAILPSRELTFHSVDTASREWEVERVTVLARIASGTAGIVVSTPEALLLRTMSLETLISSRFTVSTGKQYDIGDLRRRLVSAGYTFCDRVEGMGQCAVRGGIVDVFSPGSAQPVRIDFFDNEVDSMGYFDVLTQRRTDNINTFTILPAREVLPTLSDGFEERLEALIKSLSRRRKLPGGLLDKLKGDLERLKNNAFPSACDRYISLIYPEKTCALNYFGQDTIAIVIESSRVGESIKNLEWHHGEDMTSLLESGVLSPEQTDVYFTHDEYLKYLESRSCVLLETFVGTSTEPKPKAILSVVAKQLSSFGTSFETGVMDIKHYAKTKFNTVVLASGERKILILEEKLREIGLKPVIDYNFTSPPNKDIILTLGNLSAGMEYPTIGLAVVTEGALHKVQTRDRKRRKKKSAGETINSYSDLSVGDLVVHEHHGIGRFTGIEKIKSDGVERDYIRLAYQGSDVLYVPATSLELVSKYVGAAEDKEIKLNKLGSAEWQRTKTRAKSAAKNMAKQLIALYAERTRRPGFTFPKDDDWQLEFESAFEYEETEDQLRCTMEIKEDMIKPIPMDRLLCGDVGFGKTEVALRAVMKCILGGKQAAFLCPTTVLARQHYLTALRRFGTAPVKIAVLSRFQTPSESAEILKRLAAGSIDLIIGTHRLLSANVVFRDLGLVIIDEEQRFGVSHKEKLKEMSKNVDALTMTATPIPRTLSMALSGIRDMSMLEEAPHDRQPVQTYVLEHDISVVCDAIRRELSRGGQVYYLHNRTETISRAAGRLKDLLPEANIAIAHGKMDEEDLSDVMRGMADNEIQILVCTTIIETGIDIPNVNTLIIEDADRLGLAQLHQIRGRVGRSARRAYAYLTYRQGKVLTEVGTKRLNAIREYAGFGAGFKIAMRDLEIRGAGNILGSEQSGHLVGVGYDLYMRLLEEAVLEEKGEKTVARDCSVELSVSAIIPDAYIHTSEERMDAYRRIAFIKDKEDSEDVIDELVDRYGDSPAEVINLINIALLRRNAAKCDITSVMQTENMLKFTFTKTDFKKIARLCSCEGFKGRVMLNAGEKPYVSIRLKSSENPIAVALKLTQNLI
ncbi:MAG: transcription-repair coupling factor [Clostridiales bacterium]|nr:transcription-repair coupling factor [Clostridiales bacterium]